MGVRAPKARKHLSADALFSVVRNHFATIADERRTEGATVLADVLMAGFAMFSLKCPSLLDFDRQRAEGNLQTIYGIERVPCDTYMRKRLDPVLPDSLRPVFTGVFRQLQRGKALEAMVFFQDCYLLALDFEFYQGSSHRQPEAARVGRCLSLPPPRFVRLLAPCIWRPALWSVCSGACLWARHPVSALCSSR